MITRSSSNEASPLSPLHSEGCFFAETEPGSLCVLVDKKIYSREAILRTCYWLTDRLYIFIADHSDKSFAVRFKPKHDPTRLEEMASEFVNALIENELRVQLSKESGSVREILVAKAFGRFQSGAAS